MNGTNSMLLNDTGSSELKQLSLKYQLINGLRILILHSRGIFGNQSKLLNQKEREELMRFLELCPIEQLKTLVNIEDPKKFLDTAASFVSELRKGEVCFIRNNFRGRVERVILIGSEERTLPF